MTDNAQPRWDAITVSGKIHGIYRLPGANQWRYLKEKGEKREFATEREARDAARDRALAILFPVIHSTAAPTEKALAETLGVEQWLQSRREDRKRAATEYRPGKRPLVVMRGRA